MKTMKRLSLAILMLSFGLQFSYAQAEQAFKDAKKSYFSATNNQSDEEKVAEQLLGAADQIDKAVAGISSFDDKEAVRVYVKAGQIYQELGAIDQKAVATALLAEQEPPALKYPMAPEKAFDNYKMAVNNAGDDKKLKRDKSDAIDGLLAVRTYLDQGGRLAYQAQNYERAYELFNKVSELRDVVNGNTSKAEKKIMVEQDEYNKHLFLVGLSAMLAKKNDGAMKAFTTLYESDYDEAGVYEALFNLTLEEDKEKAIKILTEGREKYPEDESLRISEINYYLKEGKMDVLTGKLKDAITASPDNISLYLTLGSVYDNLYQKAMEANDEAEAKKNFDEALKYYNQGVAKDASNGAAVYSIGALYYNKAAVISRELVELEGDYSKAGLQKYKARRQDMLNVFDEALPYFVKAEKLDPNDQSTMIALKEIYAKKDDLNMSNIFKERLEKVKGGEKLESYFTANE